MLTFCIITLFPEAFESYFASSIIGRAIREKKVAVKFYNPRDFVKKVGANGYLRADNRPYGGGPGMVMEAEPILKAVEKALGSRKLGVRKAESQKLKAGSPPIYFFDASGKQFTNTDARRLAQMKGLRNLSFTRRRTSSKSDIVLICGHYEGVDARVQKILKAKKLSVGPYTLTGGEVPAMLVVDAVARQVPGVLGKFESVEEERVSASEVYTRPEILKWKGKNYRVPKVLLSGNHAKVDEWKKKRRG